MRARLMKMLARLRTPCWVRSLLTKAYLRTLAWSGQPIILGPMKSELGFEQLYWLPFLHWALTYAKIPPERCIALSRGGMGSLYPATRAVDLYSLAGGVDSVRNENTLRIEQNREIKQMRWTPWDRHAVQEAADSLGLTRYRTLHPSWMYWLLRPYWDEQATIRHVTRHAIFAPFPLATLPEGFGLPEKFVAVRFYERHTFPLTEQVRALCVEMVQALASHTPVVLLNQTVFADDHTDLPLKGPNIYVLPQVAPEQNFLLQAAVLARAQGFVGTYGGVAQWALRFGKPSISFYTHFGGTSFAHRALCEQIAATMQVPCEVSDLRARGLWQATLLQLIKEPVAG